MSAPTERPLWRVVVIAAVWFIALDVAVLGLIAALGFVAFSPARAALQVWQAFHWPAFEVAEVVLPRPDNDDTPSAGALIGLLVVIFLQAALIGACFGWIRERMRRRRYAL